MRVKRATKYKNLQKILALIKLRPSLLPIKLDNTKLKKGKEREKNLARSREILEHNNQICLKLTEKKRQMKMKKKEKSRMRRRRRMRRGER